MKKTSLVLTLAALLIPVASASTTTASANKAQTMHVSQKATTQTKQTAQKATAQTKQTTHKKAKAKVKHTHHKTRMHHKGKATLKTK